MDAPTISNKGIIIKLKIILKQTNPKVYLVICLAWFVAIKALLLRDKITENKALRERILKDETAPKNLEPNKVEMINSGNVNNKMAKGIEIIKTYLYNEDMPAFKRVKSFFLKNSMIYGKETNIKGETKKVIKTEAGTATWYNPANSVPLKNEIITVSDWVKIIVAKETTEINNP